MEIDGKSAPHRRCWGRDLPDGTRKRLQVLPGGGGRAFFRPKTSCFLIGRDARLQKNTVKKQYGRTPVSWTRPSKIGKRKVKKKPVFFNFFDLNFLVCKHLFFCGFRRWAWARRADFLSFLDPFFGLIFRRFCDSRKHWFFTVFFLFSACLTASFKNFQKTS